MRSSHFNQRQRTDGQLLTQPECGMSADENQLAAKSTFHIEAVAPREQVEILTDLDRMFHVIEDVSFAKLVHSSLDSGQPFQRWFRYREGFSPELIRRAVDGLQIEAASILDPFSGAGSTLVAAREAGLPSTGFEVNPVVAQIARAKTHNYSVSDGETIVETMRLIGAIDPSMPKAERPGLSILDKVFRSDVLDALLTARNVIDQVENDRAFDFLMTGWVSILEGVSNVFKEGNGVKYRNRKRTPSGYITVPWASVAGYEADGWTMVRRRLQAQYQLMVDDIALGANSPVPEIREESSVLGTSAIAPGSISLAIFSPPYCNNFNYMKIFKVELWMSGLVRSYEDIRAISSRALRSHVEMRIDVPMKRTLPTELYELIDGLDTSALWNKKIPDTILAYFLDMREVLVGTYSSLTPGGECHVVVGNSAYGGVIVPTDVMLARIARELGFEVVRVVVARHLTTSSQQRRSLQSLVGFLRESIVVLRKPKYE